ncbi:MAG: DUF835 domain-containing protein [Thermoplasmata archaeon]|nr:MAG: DUF835 domain-containing protein [Thermoplasmata archaeon]
MKTALEPCLFEYFVFLVKEQGEFKANAINEISSLWQQLAAQYGIKVNTEDLTEKIQEISTKIFMDKNVKVLDTVHSPDNLVWLRQSLAHDSLIVTFLINSKQGTSTDTPWLNWQEFYRDISDIRDNLRELYFHSTVLQTILNRDSMEDGTPADEHIIKSLQTEFEPFEVKKVKAVELPAGKLWQFGDNRKFTFTLGKENEKEASTFLANEFPYIISLLGKIENHYMLAVNLYEDLNVMERTVREEESQPKQLSQQVNIDTLEGKRIEIGQLDKKAIETVSAMRICGNNIQANITNLKSILPDSVLEQDNFIKNLVERYTDYHENIKSWSEVSDNILMRINKYTEIARTQLSELISQKQMKESVRIPPEIKSPYTSKEKGFEFEINGQHYTGTESMHGVKIFKDRPSKNVEVIEWGSNYTFYEDEPGVSLDLLKLCCQNEFESLCITRQHPDKLRKKCSMENTHTQIYWLSTTVCEYCLPPTLTRISLEISKFIKHKKRRVILLDGLEFLVNHNDFMKVLNFLDSTKENIIMHDSIFLITISPNAYSPKELSLLKKNTGVISSPAMGFDISALIQ